MVRRAPPHSAPSAPRSTRAAALPRTRAAVPAPAATAAAAARPPAAPAPARGDARTALLDAALTLVRRQGWAATSIDQLCRAAGVTKGAFFHHFASKEALGVAAAARWTELTAPLFANADYHRHADPLERLFAYLDFRAALADGPLEAITCFAGTTVQETFASSEPIRAACGRSILDHADTLVGDFRAALEAYPPRLPVDAESLAVLTQTALQGGFVLSKATGDRAPLLDGVAHLKRYFGLLFGRSPLG
ncbi:MAG: TetR/AcrR family transcriptional regulator [Gammaproteobacteria bacterium]|nr:TetR/AcrR family transcriptional regulator [Gammaproteobacteria bacterium]